MTIKERIMKFITHKGLDTAVFERKAGLSNGAVYKMGDGTRRSTIDKISVVFPELNRDWLITGKGNMLNESYDQDVAGEASGKEKSGYITYLLPMSAMGGSLTGFSEPGAMLQNCEAIISPIENVDFGITVYGESMAPEYPSGSRILIKKINPAIFIDWGKAYVLDTPNGVIVKEIHRCDKEGYIKCHSLNPDPKYSDFDVPLCEVYGIYRVLMCLSAK